MNLKLLIFLTVSHSQNIPLIVVISLALLLVIVFFYRSYYSRQRRRKEREQYRDNRMALILKSGKLRLWFYQPSNRRYYLLSKDGKTERQYNPVEFSQLYDKEEFETMRALIFDVCDDKRDEVSVSLHSSPGTGGTTKYYEIKISVIHRNKHGRPTALLGVQRDVTEKYMRQQETDQLLMRYHTVFNSSLIDMIAYDKNGVLVDINDRACATFNVQSREALYKEQNVVTDNLMFSETSIERAENTRSCTIIDFKHYPEFQKIHQDIKLRGKMYYESVFNPIRNAAGELEGLFMAGRNISEMVESFHRQQEGNRQLQKALESNEEYIANINYALQVSDVRLVSYYPKRYTLEISQGVGQTQLTFSQLRCIRLVTPRFRSIVSSLLNRMDHLTQSSLDQSFETVIHNNQGHQEWVYVSLVPMLDAQGRVDHYFGMLRKITDQIETEEKLAVERKKAQETDLLKQSFLRNMSNEIRMPLNSIINYASRYNIPHDEAEEPQYVEQIKLHTQALLKLTNDTLYLSRLDAHMEEYKKEFVDFELLFESFCRMGISDMKPGVKFYVNHAYNSLVVDIAQEQVAHIIRRLCQMSSISTTKGSIKGDYDYYRGELIIYIEDTGVGFSPELLPHCFDRFVHNERGEVYGTGLDLPIVQLLAQQMGGNVDVESEEGKGTTVRVSIPCTAKVLDKKREFTA